MNAIGGYFGLELQKGTPFYPKLIALNTGRNSLEYILQARKYNHVYIPYYTCEAILEPILKLGVTYTFYSIDNRMEIVSLPNFSKHSAVLYNNYFGLKTSYIKKLAAGQNNLIIDACHAFFCDRISGIDTFYSPRKFFGLPDGGYVSCFKNLEENFEKDKSAKRCSHLLTRIESGAEEGYPQFMENEERLSNQPIRRMSELSEAILGQLNYKSYQKKRTANFKYLHSKLASTNLIKWIKNNDLRGPLAYPYFTADETLRSRLIANKIYVATYWPNVLDWVSNDTLEYNFSKMIIPLPVDHRYAKTEMDVIVKLVNG